MSIFSFQHHRCLVDVVDTVSWNLGPIYTAFALDFNLPLPQGAPFRGVTGMGRFPVAVFPFAYPRP